MEEARLADEDILPTGDMSQYDRLNKIRLMSTGAECRAEFLKGEIKTIKEDALSPFKNQLYLKKSSVELWTAIALFFQISAAIEEAKIKSKMEDQTFYVYAYVIAGDKNIRVKVGTGQDMLDTKLMILPPIEMQVIAGFLKGEQVEEEI